MRDDKNTTWNKRLHICILSILGLGILISTIALVTNEYKRDIIKEVKPAQPDQLEYRKEELTKNESVGVNVDYIVEAINNIKVTKENDEEYKLDSSIVKDIENTNLVAGESLSINRFQFVDTLYKLILSENKLPDIYGYQVAFKDSKDIPNKYLSAICYTDYLKLIAFGDTFDGYKNITEKEIKQSMSLLEAYLNDTIELDTEDSMDDAPSELDKAQEQEREQINRNMLEQEAINTLKDRKTVDRLYGRSVAPHSNPKTLKQLEDNQNSIDKQHINAINSSGIYESENKLELDYINIDEALINYTMLSSDLDRYISGVTYMEPIGWSVETKDKEMFMRNDLILSNNGKHVVSFPVKVIGIKDNKAVCNILKTSTSDDPALYIDNIVDIDSIGFVLMRQYFENSDTKAEISMDKQDYVLVISKIK